MLNFQLKDAIISSPKSTIEAVKRSLSNDSEEFDDHYYTKVNLLPAIEHNLLATKSSVIKLERFNRVGKKMPIDPITEKR